MNFIEKIIFTTLLFLGTYCIIISGALDYTTFSSDQATMRSGIKRRSRTGLEYYQSSGQQKNQINVQSTHLNLNPGNHSDVADQLWQALMDEKPEVVDDYLNKGGDPNLILDGETPLISMLAGMNQVETLRLALDLGAQIDIRDNLGQTPLMKATQSGHIKAFELLLDRGADLDGKDNDNASVLELAVASMDNEMIDMVAERLSTQAGISEQVDQALIGAVDNGMSDAVDIILSYNPGLMEIEDSNGVNSLLMRSCAPSNQSRATLKVLLDHGLNYEDFDQSKPLLADHYQSLGRNACAQQFFDL